MRLVEHGEAVEQSEQDLGEDFTVSNRPGVREAVVRGDRSGLQR